MSPDDLFLGLCFGGLFLLYLLCELAFLAGRQTWL